MGNLFQRISDVISANINDLIDRVEDPERMIKQIIREMEENIRQAKEGVVDAIASEKQLARELAEHTRKAQQWQEKAEAALRSGNEELARAALARKKEHDRIRQNLEVTWEASATTSKNLKAQLNALEKKLAEARRKRSTLAARQRAAEARRQMTTVKDHFQKGLDAQDKFARMEDKVMEIEARSEALAELSEESSDLEREFDKITVDTEVEAELAALKKKVQQDQAPS
jgi:phage shock protein A